MISRFVTVKLCCGKIVNSNLKHKTVHVSFINIEWCLAIIRISPACSVKKTRMAEKVHPKHASLEAVSTNNGQVCCSCS